MSDISTEIARIEKAKADLKTAIEAKGVTVGGGTIDTYPALVDQIPTGGGGGGSDWVILTYSPDYVYTAPRGIRICCNEYDVVSSFSDNYINYTANLPNPGYEITDSYLSTSMYAAKIKKSTLENMSEFAIATYVDWNFRPMTASVPTLCVIHSDDSITEYENKTIKDLYTSNNKDPFTIPANTKLTFGAIDFTDVKMLVMRFNPWPIND